MMHNSEKEQSITYVATYSFRMLSDVEKSYAQIEQDVFALIFGVKKSNQYLYG